MICWKCKKELKDAQIYRTTTCEFCGADLHCCKGCEFYSVNSHWDCRESIIEPVTDKEKANFCDYFRAKKTAGASEDNTKAKAAKDAFNALFG